MSSTEDTSKVVSIRMSTATHKALTLIAQVEGSHASTLALQFIEEGVRRFADPSFVQAHIETRVQEFTTKIPQFLEDAERLRKQ